MSELSPEVIAAARAACEDPANEDDGTSCVEHWPTDDDPGIDDWCEGCLRVVGVKIAYYVKGESA